MPWLRRLIKQWTCNHPPAGLRHIRNIHGEEIVVRGYKRSEWECVFCKKRIFRDELYNTKQ